MKFYMIFPFLNPYHFLPNIIFDLLFSIIEI